MYYAQFAISLWFQKVHSADTAPDGMDCNIYFIQTSQIIHQAKIN